MTRKRFLIAVTGLLLWYGIVCAQSPGPIYTWNGTGNTWDWTRGSYGSGGQDFTTLTNNIPGQLTITEVGSEFSPGCTDSFCHVGEGHLFYDSFDWVREGDRGSGAAGGIDLTGLQFIELDISQNGTAPVQIQPYVQTGFDSAYTWFGPGPDYLPSGANWEIPPNTPTTVRIPIYQLTPAQQAYTRVIGVKVGSHVEQGYLTWTLSEVRATGTPLTTRILASHDVGSSDNGLNGAFVNFGNTAVQGNNGGQNQTGLSQNTSGSGSLQWTDLGTHGVTGAPSGAAISWGNGTALNGNNFYERPADFSNYNQVTFRMSATDVTPGGGGSVGVQAFFQTTGAYNYQTSSGGAVGQFGEINLPVDGQFHDLVFPLNAVTGLQIVPAFGAHLFSHLNDVTINVDQVRFDFVAGVPGDFNGNGIVDAADYVAWRKGASPTPNSTADYNTWRSHFGQSQGSGSVFDGNAAPEPSTLAIVFTALLGSLFVAQRKT